MARPHRKRLVVVGGVAAGMSAASRARRRDPDMEIKVFEKSGYVSYGACGLPYFIAGLIDDHHNLITYTPDFFWQQRRIEVHTRCEVTEIDLDAQQVTVWDHVEAREEKVSFDVLVLATGGSPVKPPLENVDLENVFTLRTVEDGMAIREHARSGQSRRAVIFGAGYVGLEMAEAFSRLGLQVTVIEKMSWVLGSVDQEISQLVEQELEKNRVELIKNEEVQGFEDDGSGRVCRVVTSKGVIETDMVLLAVGVEPNVALARQAGIALGRTGAIKVNEYMATSHALVWAAGDCAETYFRVLDEYDYIPFGTTANKQGRVAGENAAGGRSVFPGVVGTSTLKVFDLTVASTGINEKRAEELGIPYVTSFIRSLSRASYYPGVQPIFVKMVADARNGRLLGAQMAGYEGIAKRIDVLATALHNSMTVEEISKLDLSYAPPFAPVWDPILIAASQASKEVGKA